MIEYYEELLVGDQTTASDAAPAIASDEQVAPDANCADVNLATQQDLCALLHTVGQGIVVHRRWEILFANDTVARALGYEDAEQFKAAGTLEQHIAKGDRAHIATFVEQMMTQQRDTNTLECHARHRDGSEVQIQLTACTLSWKGKPALSSCFHINELAASDTNLELGAHSTAHALIRALQDHSDGFAIFDQHDRLTTCNNTFKYAHNCPTATALIAPGMSFKELLRLNIADGIVMGAQGREQQWLNEHLVRHALDGVDFTLRDDDGRWIRVREERTPGGGTIVISSDISALKEREHALIESERRFKDFAQTAADWFFETDAQLKLTYISDRHEKNTGWRPAEVLGKRLWEVYRSSTQDDSVVETHKELLQAHEPYSTELTSQCPNGETRVFRYAGQPVFDASGFKGYRGTGRDVTDAHKMAAKMAYRATHDKLTGLVNREEFEHRLERALASCRNSETLHSLCYLDLDQFKIINDSCGHHAGDELLRQLGQLLSKQLRKSDTLARLGGDEFGVLLNNCPQEHAHKIANALRTSVADFRFLWDKQVFSVGVSIGLLEISKHNADITEVLRAADTACYMAKENGRNRVHVYREDDSELTHRHGEMQWVTRITDALRDDRFKLAYQSIVPVNSSQEPNAGLRFEVLLRMLDNNGDVVPPGAFLPAVERYHLATRIDQWVINSALQWLSANKALTNRLELCSINISGQSLGDESLLTFICASLERHAVEGAKICFEITETASIANLANASRFMHTLKARGILFALDDFGSGLSSFGYLKNLPVDFLKIDGTFVKDIAHDPIDLAMVKSINEIGHVMGKITIAEFVENDDILEKLKDIGVNYAQGYGIDMPRWLERLN